MAILGWLVLLVVTLALGFASFAVVMLSSRVRGKVDPEVWVVLTITAAMVWLTIHHSPFTVTYAP